MRRERRCDDRAVSFETTRRAIRALPEVDELGEDELDSLELLLAADVPACAECARSWEDPRERFRAYRLDDLDEPPELGLWCPDCAAREFG